MLNPATLIVGAPVLSHLAVDVLKGTISGLCSTISYFCISSEHCVTTAEIKRYLETRDILFKLSYVDMKLKTHLPPNDSETLVLSLMEDICKKIKNELEHIQTLLKEHNGKWFASWRQSGVKIDVLDLYCSILDERIKLFVHL
jgi:hypothetical protein